MIDMAGSILRSSIKLLAFSSSVLFFLAVCNNLIDVGEGHGYMYDPPSRSSVWRVGFNVPEDEKNYNDMELNCGGREAQHNAINQGRCGECGDEWKLGRPRPNDEGGKYDTGIITQTYTEGSVVRLTVNVTANHFGYFVFRLCPKQTANELVTQECLDRYPLELVEMPGQGDGIVDGVNFHIGSTTGLYFPSVKLPAGVTCENCVLQWFWTVANSEGLCPNGATGYCYQESFVNCADVSILPKRL